MKITKSRLMEIIKEELATLDERGPVGDERGPEEDDPGMIEEEDLEEDAEKLEEVEELEEELGDPSSREERVYQNSRTKPGPYRAGGKGPSNYGRRSSERGVDRYDESRITKESLKKFVASEIKSLLEGSAKKRQGGG